MLFSIIVGYKNRDVERVKQSIDSLDNQIFKDFELIFVDYGSDQHIASTVKPLVESYSFAQYYYSETRGWLWSRAHALNSGLKFAIGEIILFFDIDLIIESNFLKKISTLNFDDFFFTFSCFYLPEKFDYVNADMFTRGRNYEQNYVGLCAVKKESVMQINGFDEYFMVWGGEDDDIYKRLALIGLERKQMPLSQFVSFHQWHPLHSPEKPGLWYLTMVNYLHKNITSVRGNNDWGKLITDVDRPIQKKIDSNDFDTELKLLAVNPILLFNDLLNGFYNQNKKSGFLAYDIIDIGERRNKLSSMLFRKNTNPLDKFINTKTIAEFLYYLIGTNRILLQDYFIDIKSTSVRFYYTKTPVING